MPEPIKLLTTRSDAEIAVDVKKTLLNYLTNVCELMDAAQSAGLTVTFSIGKDWRNKNMIAALNVIKVL